MVKFTKPASSLQFTTDLTSHNNVHLEALSSNLPPQHYGPLPYQPPQHGGLLPLYPPQHTGPLPFIPNPPSLIVEDPNMPLPPTDPTTGLPYEHTKPVDLHPAEGPPNGTIVEITPLDNGGSLITSILLDEHGRPIAQTNSLDLLPDVQAPAVPHDLVPAPFDPNMPLPPTDPTTGLPYEHTKPVDLHPAEGPPNGTIVEITPLDNGGSLITSILLDEHGRPIAQTNSLDLLPDVQAPAVPHDLVPAPFDPNMPLPPTDPTTGLPYEHTKPVDLHPAEGPPNGTIVEITPLDNGGSLITSILLDEHGRPIAQTNSLDLLPDVQAPAVPHDLVPAPFDPNMPLPPTDPTTGLPYEHTKPVDLHPAEGPPNGTIVEITPLDNGGSLITSILLDEHGRPIAQTNSLDLLPDVQAPAVPHDLVPAPFDPNMPLPPTDPTTGLPYEHTKPVDLHPAEGPPNGTIVEITPLDNGGSLITSILLDEHGRPIAQTNSLDLLPDVQAPAVPHDLVPAPFDPNMPLPPTDPTTGLPYEHTKPVDLHPAEGPPNGTIVEITPLDNGGSLITSILLDEHGRPIAQTNQIDPRDMLVSQDHHFDPIQTTVTSNEVSNDKISLHELVSSPTEGAPADVAINSFSNADILHSIMSNILDDHNTHNG